MPVMCERGYHASRRIMDALRYAPGSMLSRVELRGTFIEDADKAVATERKVVWVLDCDKVLHGFACDCAERALKRECKAGREPDARSWDTIRVTRRWLAGEATDAELAAAGAVAGAAAWAAAGAAAWADEQQWQERRLLALVARARRTR
jgi:hypothetical protein